MGAIEITKKSCLQPQTTTEPKNIIFGSGTLQQTCDYQLQQDPLKKAFSKGILNTRIIASNNKLEMNNIKKQHILDQQSTNVRSNKKRVSLQNKLQALSQIYQDQELKNQTQIKLQKQREQSINKQDKTTELDNSKQTITALKSQPIFKPVSISQSKILKVKYKKIEDFYKFQFKIGQGSYGAVYKASCRKTNQQRAIKLIKQSCLDPKKRQIILQQIRILIKMNHPNIIKVYEVIQNKGYYYIITQLCEGGSIDHFLKLNKTFYNEELIKKIMKKILSAVKYIHSQHVVHRDIKFGNIVFQKILIDGKQDIIIKIIDFGLAKQLDYTQQKQKRLVGTSVYMSPQAIDGLVTYKWDVWSCGVILYTLLKGINPFEGKIRQDIFDNIKTKVLTFQGFQWNHISYQARDLLRKMLVKQHYKRISSSEALEHSWFKDLSSNVQINSKNQILLNQVVPRLLNYKRQNNLFAFVQSYIALTKLSQIQRQKYTKYFNLIDQNEDGYISSVQLKEYLLKNKFQMKEDKIQQLINDLDRNGNHSIDLNQFFCAVFDRQKYMKSNCSMQILSDVFNFADQNNDGYIDYKQLKNALGLKQSQQLKYYLSSLDKNQDQKISQNQFIQYIKTNTRQSTVQ